MTKLLAIHQSKNLSFPSGVSSTNNAPCGISWTASDTTFTLEEIFSEIDQPLVPWHTELYPSCQTIHKGLGYARYSYLLTIYHNQLNVGLKTYAILPREPDPNAT